MKNTKYTLYTFLFLALISLCSTTFATKHQVAVGNFFFNPATLNVNVGDTIKWVWSAGTHTTTSNPGEIPAGAASWDALITSGITTFEYKVTVAGNYTYVCTPHAPSMAGTFTATAAAPTLSIAPSNRSVTSAAGSTTFAVTSNAAWSASSNAAWCTVNTNGSGNGTINANYEVNTSTVQRIATITVMVPGLPDQLVTVTQAASTVGVDNQVSGELRVFPNPTKGIFKVQSGKNSEETLEISIMDISGKLIQTKICTGQQEYTFDITHEPVGYYFIRLKSDDKTQVRRIVRID